MGKYASPGFSFGMDDSPTPQDVYGQQMGDIYGKGLSVSNYQNLAMQDALGKQQREKALFEQGLANNQSTLAHQRAMELSRLKQQPLNSFVSSWGQSQNGGQNSLAALMEAYKGMFGGGGQSQMQGNWNSLAQMLGGRRG